MVYLQGLAVAFGEWTGPGPGAGGGRGGGGLTGGPGPGEHVTGGGLTDHMLEQLDDVQVFEALIALKGIGAWWGPTPPPPPPPPLMVILSCVVLGDVTTLTCCIG